VEKGILLFQFSIPITEARAFSLTENFPVIVLNSKDSYPARIFSAFHELGHLFLDQPGLCLPEIGKPAKDLTPVERLCNTAAGLALVPTNGLLSQLQVQAISRGANLRESLRPLARVFGVSRQVILRRLTDEGVISWNTFGRMMALLRAEFEEQEALKKKRKIVVPPSVKAVARLGNRFVNDVLEARARGSITEADLAEFLGLKLQHVPEVQSLVGAE
jgi:Zn-dependent peptidase ImmA (M78 family)